MIGNPESFRNIQLINLFNIVLHKFKYENIAAFYNILQS